MSLPKEHELFATCQALMAGERRGPGGLVWGPRHQHPGSRVVWGSMRSCGEGRGAGLGWAFAPRVESPNPGAHVPAAAMRAGRSKARVEIHFREGESPGRRLRLLRVPWKQQRQRDATQRRQGLLFSRFSSQGALPLGRKPAQLRGLGSPRVLGAPWHRRFWLGERGEGGRPAGSTPAWPQGTREGPLSPGRRMGVWGGVSPLLLHACQRGTQEPVCRSGLPPSWGGLCTPPPREQGSRASSAPAPPSDERASLMLGYCPPGGNQMKPHGLVEGMDVRQN